MSLFKYLPLERLDVLQTLRLRYSQPAVLNDPFEAKPFYTGFAPDEDMRRGYSGRFRKVLLEQYESMSNDFKKGLPFPVFADLMEHNRADVYHIFQTVDAEIVSPLNVMLHESFGQKIGALSLSEVNDNQLMWSHYADSHKGFVLEFDGTHACFTRPGIAADDLWQLHRVKYAQKRPRTTAIELDMQAILLTKHESWSYEREWKAFRPLNEACCTIEGDLLPVHLFAIPPKSLRSIIFGARMPRATRFNVISIVRADPSIRHLRISEAVIDDRDYSLYMRPLDFGES